MTPDSASPLRLAGLALTLPFRGARALFLCARLMLGIWILGWLVTSTILHGLAKPAETPWRFLLVTVILCTLLGTAFAGYSLAAGWRRVVTAWPESPGRISLYTQEPPGAFRAFSLFSDPRGFLLHLVTLVPVAALAILAIVAAFFFLGPSIGAVAFAVLPILPLSLGTSVESPRHRAAVPDRPRHRFRSRFTVSALVIAPTWLLLCATLGAAYFGLRAVPLATAPLILIPAVAPFILCLSWTSAATTLLAKQHPAEAAVFD